MTESQALEVLAEAIARAGGVRAFARLAEVSPSFVSLALRGKAPVSDRLWHAAGLRREVRYVRIA